jgi:hypothetical protein
MVQKFGKTAASSSVFKRKFHLRGNNSVCAAPSHLLLGGALAQLTGSITDVSFFLYL